MLKSYIAMKKFSPLYLLLLVSAITLSACTSNPQVKQQSSHPNTHSTQELGNTRVYEELNHKPPQSIPSELAHTNHNYDPVFENNQLYSQHNSSGNIWDQMAGGFQLFEYYDLYPVQKMLSRYSGNQRFFNRLQPRAQKYLHYIISEASRRGMPLEVAIVPIVESDLNPFAVSRSGAMGMWQFIKSTGTSFKLYDTSDERLRRHVILSTHAGLDYLQSLYNQFGDWTLAFAAYNGGQGTVRRAIRRNMERGLSTDYWSLPLSQETREYVPKILAIANVIQNPTIYGVHLPYVKSQPAFKKFQVSGSYSVSQLAQCASMPTAEFYQYNPQFRRGTTANKNHLILIPTANTSHFEQRQNNINSNCAGLSRVATHKQMKSVNHRVASVYTPKPYKPAVKKPVNKKPVVKKPVVKKPAIKKPTVAKVAPKKPVQKKPAVKKPSTAKVAKTTKPAKKKILHKVEGGETLWRIAYNHKIELNDLMAWNNIQDKTKVRSGQVLTIWK